MDLMINSLDNTAWVSKMCIIIWLDVATRL